MKALIAGASGMVGNIVLKNCLKGDDFTEVVVLTRKSLKLKHPKLTEVNLEDFTNLESTGSYFKDSHACFFCIGVYTGTVSDEIFKKITVDISNVFVDQMIQHCPEATLSYLSGAGADRIEKSRISFARYKGMAENYALSSLISGIQIFRPGYIYPIEKREEPNLMYRISRWLYPVLKLMGPNASITSEELALGLYKGALLRGERRTYENKDIKDLLST